MYGGDLFHVTHQRTMMPLNVNWVEHKRMEFRQSLRDGEMAMSSTWLPIAALLIKTRPTNLL
jgi:hypothetical protein